MQFSFFNPHLGIVFIDLRERGKEKGKDGERERGSEEERERKINIDWWPPVHTRTRGQICTLGMCPDRAKVHF